MSSYLLGATTSQQGFQQPLSPLCFARAYCHRQWPGEAGSWKSLDVVGTKWLILLSCIAFLWLAILTLTFLVALVYN